MISERNQKLLEQVLQEEDSDDVQDWAIENLSLCTEAAKAEARQEGEEDGFNAARQEAENNAPIDPLAVINSALAHGRIGRVPWALVERGDGLILAIGGENIPIDTAREAQQAIDAATNIHHYVLCVKPLVLRDWPGTLP